MTTVWLLILIPAVVVLLAVPLVSHYYFRQRFTRHIVDIFQYKPMFIIPRGQPVEGAEEIDIPSSNGLILKACYFHTTQRERKVVILFGLEFGSNRWACYPYCEHLIDQGYDVFTFEPRGQGDSQPMPGYDPLQWITEYDIEDGRAAVKYLKSRPDADPNGVGLFGISKGGNIGLQIAAEDPYIKCFATDGVFATMTTLLPYMKKWLAIYSRIDAIHPYVPHWYFVILGRISIARTEKIRKCRFVHMEKAIPKLAPRPWLMIHGGGDTYIKPEMAQALFDRAGQPKEAWFVEGAKHNLAIQIAREEYQRRILEFFNHHLAGAHPANAPAEEAVATGQ